MFEKNPNKRQSSKYIVAKIEVFENLWLLYLFKVLFFNFFLFQKKKLKEAILDEWLIKCIKRII